MAKRGTWVFNPNSSRKQIPELVRRTDARLRRYAEENYANGRADSRFGSAATSTTSTRIRNLRTRQLAQIPSRICSRRGQPVVSTVVRSPSSTDPNPRTDDDMTEQHVSILEEFAAEAIRLGAEQFEVEDKSAQPSPAISVSELVH